MRNPSARLDRLAEVLGDGAPVAHRGGEVVDPERRPCLGCRDDRERVGGALEPVRLVVRVAVADDHVEGRRADRGPRIRDGGVELLDGEVHAQRRRGGHPGEGGRRDGRGLGGGDERLGGDVGGLAADAELVAEHDRDAGAQRHEHRERDAGEETPSGSRHHVEQRSKKWDDRPS